MSSASQPTLPETHKLKCISQDVTIIRGETDAMTFEKLHFDAFPAMIKTLNLFVLKSHWTIHKQAHKRDFRSNSPHRHLSLPFTSPFLTLLKGWQYCTFQCITLVKWKDNYPHPQLKNVNHASAMILPRRNLKQLLQQKVAHMERNVHWKTVPTLRKKVNPFILKSSTQCLYLKNWLKTNW